MIINEQISILFNSQRCRLIDGCRWKFTVVVVEIYQGLTSLIGRFFKGSSQTFLSKSMISRCVSTTNNNLFEISHHNIIYFTTSSIVFFFLSFLAIRIELLFRSDPPTSGWVHFLTLQMSHELKELETLYLVLSLQLSTTSSSYYNWLLSYYKIMSQFV